MALSKHTFDMHMRRNIKRNVRTEIDSAKWIDSLFYWPLWHIDFFFVVGYFYDAWAYKPSLSWYFVFFFFLIFSSINFLLIETIHETENQT